MQKTISLEDFILFVRRGYASRCIDKIKLTKKERELVKKNRENLERLVQNQSIYGFNTGIGPFFSESIPPEDQSEYQENLLLSHAVGTGEYLSPEEARGMMFLLINMLRKGYSGISPETLEAVISLFNHCVTPAIPIQGSVGASGDLAPLAHLALVLIGKGYVLIDGKPVPTRYSFDFEHGRIAPIKLKPGEAISIINGTHFMTSLLALAVYESEILSKTADIAAALTILALKGNIGALDDELQRLRPHPGQAVTARNLKLLLGQSDLPYRFLQDAYSLRCVPQVHGSVKETIRYARQVVIKEINSISGNPILVNNRLIHGGNFHGQILAAAADFLSISLTTLANISERRIERLLNQQFSGLSPFLSQNPGLDSGLMILQNTAADLCSQNKVLSHPSSVDSIPLAAGQEDFVSMGAGAVRKVRKICANIINVIAIELLCVLRALDLQDCQRSDTKLLEVCNAIKQRIISRGDRTPSEAISEVSKLIESGWVLREAEKLVGPLD